MNLRRAVWLPPDGDNRLIHFQQDLARLLARPDWEAVPAHLELTHPEVPPDGAVSLGNWVERSGESVLEGRDSHGTVGVFRFGPDGVTLSTEERLLLPVAPAWVWTKGRLATLERVDTGRPGFILWSWQNQRGWKAALPRA